MAKVIVAPDPVPYTGHRIFLAGAIDMGAAVDWQAVVVDAFQNDNVALLNPRRAVPFAPEMLDEQVKWELNALKYATIILMWLPVDAKAPISLFEAGLFWRSGKLIIGAEPGFYRRRNLELTAEAYGYGPVYDNLASVVIAAKRAAGLRNAQAVS